MRRQTSAAGGLLADRGLIVLCLLLWSSLARAEGGWLTRFAGTVSCVHTEASVADDRRDRTLSELEAIAVAAQEGTAGIPALENHAVFGRGRREQEAACRALARLGVCRSRSKSRPLLAAWPATQNMRSHRGHIGEIAVW